MASTPIEMTLTGNGFGTPEMRRIFSEEARVQKWLDVEAALAAVQAELGIIPREAAKVIIRHCDVRLLNLEAIARDAARIRHSLVPTLRAVQALCGEVGQYLHYGPTTQDITDTGLVLQLKEAHAVIVRDLKEIARVLAELALRWRDTPVTARTHGQQGLPTTFGFKLAVLLSEVGRHLERLAQLEDRVFCGVLSGAVGTYASMGAHGREVERRVMERLGLRPADICWHSARDRLAEYVAVLGMISATLGKLGHEVYNLSRQEIDEVEEPFEIGKVGSSTMPHKRNPAAAEGLMSLSRLVRYHVPLMLEAMIVDHERDAAGRRTEWVAVPEACIYLSAQLRSAKAVLEGLIVKPDNMAKNLNLLGGLVLSERIMFALGQHWGKQTAHEVVYELAMHAFSNNIPFSEALAADERVRSVLSEDELKALLDPDGYLGQAPQMVDEVVAAARRWL